MKGTTVQCDLAPTEDEILAVHTIVQDAMRRNALLYGGFTMAEGDEDDDTDDPDDDDASGDDDPDDPGTEGQGGKKKKKDADDDASGESEVERVRKRMRAADQRAAAAERELQELKDKDKPELERAQARVTELEPQVETLTSTVRDLRLRIAFLSDNSYQWHDPEAALQLVDLEDVEIDDDGKVTGLKNALKKLATEKKYLVKVDKKDDDDDDEPEPSGSQQNGKRKGEKASATREALAKKYPALRR